MTEMYAQGSYQENYQAVVAHKSDPATAHSSSVEEIPVSNEVAIAAPAQQPAQQPPTLFYTFKVQDQSDVIDKSSAGFNFEIERGGAIKAADWAVS